LHYFSRIAFNNLKKTERQHIMKIRITFILLPLFAACSWNFEKIEIPQNERVELASEFAHIYLSSLRDSVMLEDYSMIIDDMTKGLQEDTTFSMYKQIKERFGDYDTSIFYDAYLQQGADPLEVYRFKGEFLEHTDPIDVRVVLNREKQIAGFAVRPWKEEFR
jgi:hypothetical protein